MLHICTWLWSQNGYRSHFTAEHVNTLRSMVRRNLTLPHEFVCITDTPAGLDPSIRVLRLPETPTVEWQAHRPNCFRRLWLFSDAARYLVGERIACMDLDCVVLQQQQLAPAGSLDALFDRDEDFVGWRDPLYGSGFNGSMWLLTAGSRRKVWDEFTGTGSLRRLAGRRGSDQAWLSVVLGKEAAWSAKDGVLSYRIDARRRLPKHSRVVFFHGKPDPWECEHVSWVRENYR